MIVVELKGGLGNQMFQYAAGLALAEKVGSEVYVDISKFKHDPLRDFSLDSFLYQPKLPPLNYQMVNLLHDNFLVRRMSHEVKIALENISLLKIYRQKGYSYGKDFEELGDDVKLVGYFQSEKYFGEHEKAIRKAFEFKARDKKHKLLKKIRSTNSVSLHVRRTDYLMPKNVKTHGLLTKDYYKKALKKIEAKQKNINVFAFSDDPGWVKDNFGFVKNLNVVDDTKRPTQDMFLMSQCKHHIVANSSFSWWGAWLAKSKNQIVVAPKNWFSDPKAVNPDIYKQGWGKV